MARANSSLPVPLGPSMSTVLLLAGDLRQDLEQSHHRGAAADDVLKGVSGLKFFLKLLDLGQVLERLDPANNGSLIVHQ